MCTGDEIVFEDLIPHSYGLRVCGRNPRVRADDQMDMLIPKGSKYPISKRVVKRTARANQSKFPISVLQGENDYADYDTLIGEHEITEIPPGKRGEVKSTIEFAVDESGILRVKAYLGEVDNLNGEGVVELKIKAGGMDMNDEERDEAIEYHRRMNENTQRLKAERA